MTAAFHNLRYLRINARRLEHLATLALPVEQRTVLELGAGIGDLTSFFLDRGCSVTSIEPRSENVAAFRARYAESPFWPAARLTIIQADAAAIDAVPGLAPHQVVFCYGLLYHLADPAVVLRRAAALCSELMLVETVVAYGREDDALESIEENPRDPTMSVSGQACKPSRRWVFNRLHESFPLVYMPRTQPAHDQFPLDWTSRELPPGRSRAIFVASRQPLDSPLLVERVPDRQFHSTGSNQIVPARGESVGEGGGIIQ
jgi:predicted RNA methylase